MLLKEFSFENHITGNDAASGYLGEENLAQPMPKLQLSAQQNGVVQQIQTARRGGDYRRIVKNIGKETLSKFLQDLYPANTVPELENSIGVPHSTIENWLKTLNIPRKRWHAKITSHLGEMDAVEITETATTAAYAHKVKLTPDLAYLIGFALGDGNIEPYSVATYNKDMGPINELTRICKTYGNVTIRERGDGLHKLRLSSRKIACLIREDGKIREDTIDYILKDPTCSEFFIAAFWDAEGSVGRYKQRYLSDDIILYNTNKELLEKIARKLYEFGIETTAISYSDFKRQFELNGRPIRQRKVMYRIRIRQRDVVKWAKNIGIHMKHSKKADAVKRILKQDLNS